MRISCYNMVLYLRPPGGSWPLTSMHTGLISYVCCYVCELFTWRWHHHAMSIIRAMPSQLPLWLAVAPNEPLPPRASLQSADRAEPEEPPAHTSTQMLSHRQPPPPIEPSSISAPPHLGPVSGCECVCGHVGGRYVHCQLVHAVDGLQKSFFTLGLRMTRQFLGGRRGGCVFVDSTPVHLYLCIPAVNVWLCGRACCWWLARRSCGSGRPSPLRRERQCSQRWAAA